MSISNEKVENRGDKVENRGRGFASMDRTRQREISSQGGKAAHQKGTAHEFNSNEAREAGRKGGMVSGGRRRSREAANTNDAAPADSADRPGEDPSKGTEADHPA
jgi:general stress protein YciG